MNDANHAAFENEVRRIAHLRWPTATDGGVELVDGRERDGVFITDECVHLIEATVSRSRDKAAADLAKMFHLKKSMSRTESTFGPRAFKCWLITFHEPTAEQREARKQVKNCSEPNLFHIQSFEEFRSALFQDMEYVACRNQHVFGSVVDPKSHRPVTNIEFIDVGVRVTNETNVVSVKDFAHRLCEGERFCLVGEYGVGKSMFLREIYQQIRNWLTSQRTRTVPIHLNLREHQGQTDAAEILERHARSIGFAHPSQLVKAWKAGFVTLLLDGFDEVSSAGLQGAWRRIKEARRASLAGIRRLIELTPENTGIAICGRDNFFDTERERRECLDMSTKWRDVRMDAFTDDQIQKLAHVLGFDGSIPQWIPSRPLLVATLLAGAGDAAKNASEILCDPASGWDHLLDSVSRREAKIDFNVSGSNIRSILERLATVARRKFDGLGPLSRTEIVEVFERECGFSPTDQALIVLQRLPGLGSNVSFESDTRSFVDDDFADALRSGDLVRFIHNPYDDGVELLLEAGIPVGQVGIQLAVFLLEQARVTAGMVLGAIEAARRRKAKGALMSDLVKIAGAFQAPITSPIQIDDVTLRHIEIGDPLSANPNATYRECVIDLIEVPTGVSESEFPTFVNCIVQRLDGRGSINDLPDGRFEGCAIETFVTQAETNDAVLAQSLPVGTRVLSVVLRKLFVQSITGRKESALYRGLDAFHQAKVPEVIDLLRSHGFVQSITRQGEPIWIPVRKTRRRVLDILSAPSESCDPLIVQARLL